MTSSHFCRIADHATFDSLTPEKFDPTLITTARDRDLLLAIVNKINEDRGLMFGDGWLFVRDGLRFALREMAKVMKTRRRLPRCAKTSQPTD